MRIISKFSKVQIAEAIFHRNIHFFHNKRQIKLTEKCHIQQMKINEFYMRIISKVSKGLADW